MKTNHRLLLPVLSLVATGMAGCTNANVDYEVAQTSELNEDAGPRRGETIPSPSVEPSAMYWGSRSIEVLGKVGVPVALQTLAKRADGIIANTPPNGRIGVDELARIESAEHIDTLFPEERAALPKLWELLRMPAELSSVPPPPTFAAPVVVDETVAAPLQLPVRQSGSEELARRIELTHDSDGNPNTISGDDVRRALIDSSSYLPTEVAAFPSIVDAIAASAKPHAAELRRVNLPAPVEGNVVEAPGVRIGYRYWEAVEPWKLVGAQSATSTVHRFVTLSMTKVDEAVTLVAFSMNHGGDQLLEVPSVTQGRAYEVWKAGERVGVIGVEGPPSESLAVGSVPWGVAQRDVDGTSTLNFSSNFDLDRRFYAKLPSDGPWSSPKLQGSFAIVGTDARVDVMATGYALVRSGKATFTCRPFLPTRAELVDECQVFDGAGVAKGKLTFRRNGSPAVGASTIDGLAGELYPF